MKREQYRDGLGEISAVTIVIYVVSLVLSAVAGCVSLCLCMN